MKSRFALFKYCARYLIAFLAVLAICLPIVWATRTTLQEKLLKESEIYLENGLASFDDSVSQMLQLANTISKQDDFVAVSNVTDDPASAVLSISKLNATLNEMSLLFTSSPFFFVLFENNDIFVSSQQASYNLHSYFGTMLQVKDEQGKHLSLPDFKAEIFSNPDTFSALYYHDFSSYYDEKLHESEEMIIFVIRSSFYDLSSVSNPYCICFAIPKHDFVQNFTNPTLADGCQFTLQMPQGDALFATHDALTNLQSNVINTGETVSLSKENYWLLQNKSPSSNWTATLAVPETVIKQELDRVLNVLYLYIVVGFLVVLVLTLNFAYRQYDTVQQFYSILTGAGKPKTTHHDQAYAKLYDILNDIKQNEKEFESKSIELQRMKTNSILAHYIVHGAKSKLAFTQFQESIPQDISHYCIVFMQINTPSQTDYDYAVLCALEYLDTYPEYGFINFHTGINREVFFVQVPSDDPAHSDKISSIFNHLSTTLHDDKEVTFHIGISELSNRIANAHQYFNQANDVVRASLYQPVANPATVYSKEIALGAGNLVDIHYLERFHHLLMLGKHEDIRDLFDNMLTYYKQNVLQFEVYKEQTYYSIQNLIFSAGLNFRSMELMHAILPQYSAYDTIDTVVDKFLQSSLMICDWVQENAHNQTLALAQDAENYIMDHFVDCDLSTYVVSQALSISENKLQNAIKQKYGKSFSSYLEQIRIEQAVVFLETTNMSNEDICLHTGFSAISTFYRVFNKWKGVSPGAWRAQRKG